MTQVNIDAQLTKKLSQLACSVDLCDPNGHVLGRFTPRLDPSRYDLEPKISTEEHERRKNSIEKTLTTAEVLAHLEQL